MSTVQLPYMQPNDWQSLYNVDLNDKTIIENDYLRNMLNVSNEANPIDSELKKTVGLKAVQDYYSHWKMLDKALDQDECLGIEASVYSSMQRACSENLL